MNGLAAQKDTRTTSATETANAGRKQVCDGVVLTQQLGSCKIANSVKQRPPDNYLQRKYR